MPLTFDIETWFMVIVHPLTTMQAALFMLSMRDSAKWN